MTTFADLVAEARDCLGIDYAGREGRDMLRAGVDSGEVHDLAHEYADGHHRVIYYSESRSLWAEGVSTEYEADAEDCRPEGGWESIDAALTACAYWTLRAAFTDAVDEYLEAHADDAADELLAGISLT